MAMMMMSLSALEAAKDGNDYDDIVWRRQRMATMMNCCQRWRRLTMATMMNLLSALESQRHCQRRWLTAMAMSASMVDSKCNECVDS